MKNPLRIAILAGGIFNLLFSLFHVYLCYQLYQIYGTMPIYPLLQMFSIVGTIMIFFLAYTSLCCPTELLSTNAGLAVVVLNILVYLSRVIGEIVLFPQPMSIIIATCLLMTLIYGYVLVEGIRDRNSEQNIAAIAG
ncbi:MAG: hypothetical protein HY961_18275 [Ignavibacteriae bacterium]|nr:hypothetical protein [Ignavibacteriota bacterium]